MSKPISKVKKRLLQCIQGVSKNAWLFFTAPEKDFTRNRKLSFETIQSLIPKIGQRGDRQYDRLVVQCAFGINNFMHDAFDIFLKADIL